jgi:hypothetical protein
MLPEMHNVLLDLALLTVGAYSLVVGAVPLTVSLYVDRSYVDGSSCVVFIIDTITSLPPYDVECQAFCFEGHTSCLKLPAVGQDAVDLGRG